MLKLIVYGISDIFYKHKYTAFLHKTTNFAKWISSFKQQTPTELPVPD